MQRYKKKCRRKDDGNNFLSSATGWRFMTGDYIELTEQELKQVKSEIRTDKFKSKLMPLIKYLSEKMGFNDNLIKALCTFKEITVMEYR